MKEIVDIGGFSLFALMIVFMIWAGFVRYKVLRILKQDHPDVWTKLGSPTLFLNNSIRNGYLLNKYLRKREYLSLEDERLTRLCNESKLIGWIVAPILCVFIILVIVAIVHFAR